MIIGGCDLGSATGKVVIMNNNTILSWSVVRSTRSPEMTAQLAMEEALGRAGLSAVADLQYIIGTGYGRMGVSFINDNLSEITCHAQGAHWLYPTVGTVVDIGGQDCKVISLDGRGKVLEFAMNDKCAAGTGRFFEAMARALDCSLEELSALSLQSNTPAAITKQCSVFAESEVVTLINNGISAADISAGLHDSIARRIHSMVYKVGINPDVVLTGGCANNEGLVKSLENRLGVSIAKLPQNPQIAGALGAALFAREKAAK
jgi:predicted CoA-substrate-specific enzyme activase